MMLTKDQLQRPNKEMTEELNYKKLLMTINREDQPEMPTDKLFQISLVYSIPI